MKFIFILNLIIVSQIACADKKSDQTPPAAAAAPQAQNDATPPDSQPMNDVLKRLFNR